MANKKKKEKKPKSKTLKTYRRLKLTSRLLYASTYVMPLIPAAIMVGINWDEWVAQTNNGWSLGLGFGSMLLAVLVTIVGIAKRDEIVEEKVSPLFYFAALLSVWSVALLFLATIAHELGIMLGYTVVGLVGAGVADQVNKNVIKPKREMYKEIVDEAGLDEKAIARKRKKEQLLKQAEKEKRERQAFE